MTSKIIIDESGRVTECPAVEEVHLTEDAKIITAGPFMLNKYKNTYVKKLTLAKSTIHIEDEAFAISGIEEINIKDGLSKIGKCGFYLSELRHIYLPDSVTSIGICCFAKCFNLKYARLSSNMDIVPSSAFENSGLRSVVIPDGVKEIEEYAFYLNKIETLILPSSVQKIKKNAFKKAFSPILSKQNATIIYLGTQDEFDKIDIEKGNRQLKKLVKCKGKMNEQDALLSL